MVHNNIQVLAVAERICLYHNIQAKLLMVHSTVHSNTVLSNTVPSSTVPSSIAHSSIKVLVPTVRNHMPHSNTGLSNMGLSNKGNSNHNSHGSMLGLGQMGHRSLEINSLLPCTHRNILVRCSFHQHQGLVRFRLPGICPHRLWQPMPWSN